MALTLDAVKIVLEKLQFFQHKFITLHRCRHDELIPPKSLNKSPAVSYFSYLHCGKKNGVVLIFGCKTQNNCIDLGRILWAHLGRHRAVEPLCCNKWQKSPCRETGLGNRGRLKVLVEWYQIGSKSFSASRGRSPIPQTSIIDRDFFLPIRTVMKQNDTFTPTHFYSFY